MAEMLYLNYGSEDAGDGVPAVWMSVNRYDGYDGESVAFSDEFPPGRIPADVERTFRQMAASGDLLAACRLAEQFIRNGIELGYIHIPTNDPAAATLGVIRDAIHNASEES